MLIQAGSRFLLDIESKYAIINLELLHVAVTWAVTKCNIFLAGLLHFILLTDHHSLVPILNIYRLNEVQNPRLQWLRLKIVGYNFTAQLTNCMLNNVPDALSHNAASNPLPHEVMAENDPQDNTEPSICKIRATLTNQISSPHLEDLRQYAQADQEY